MLTPMGDYALTSVAGDLVFVAGMTPRDDQGRLVPGVVGDDVDLASARAAARVAADRALAAAGTAPGAPGPVERVVSLTVYVRCAAGFTEVSAVADGASAAIAERLPGAARPARAAVGVLALPGGAPVEVSLTCLSTERR